MRELIEVRPTPRPPAVLDLVDHLAPGAVVRPRAPKPVGTLYHHGGLLVDFGLALPHHDVALDTGEDLERLAVPLRHLLEDSVRLGCVAIRKRPRPEAAD